MGGSKKKQTVGYKYYAGTSMIFCQGTIDKLINISVADRIAWKGSLQDGTLFVDKPSLFGGESREGGLSGSVDVYSGHDKHSRNSYLASKISQIVPAYRYVAGAVFKHFYWGNNPYLKDIAVVVQRIHYQDAKKTPQWYNEKAEIRSEGGLGNTAIHFILDTSNSMSGSRITALKTAMKRAINNLETSMDLASSRLDILITTYQGGSPQTKLIRKVSENDISPLLSFIDDLKIVGGDNLESVLNASVSFFKEVVNFDMNRCCIFVSDGELENVDSIKNNDIHDLINKSGRFNIANGRDVDIYCINVGNHNVSLSAKIDNTPEDGIPVIVGSDSSLIYDTMMYAINGPNADMNPAHILRELVLSQYTGFNSQSVQNIINEESFKQAADIFYQEKLGLSYLWNNQSKFEDLKKNIEKTVDCVLDQNAQTNQFEIKLIRNNYNIDELPIFDKTNIVKISDIKKNIVTEMINSVTVNFIDRTNDYKQGSVTVRDDALITMAGRENNTTVTYDTVYSRSLASRLAMRDLAYLSSDLASVTLTLNLDGRMLSRGDVFLLNMPQLGLGNVVMRIISVDYGTQKSNQVTIECSRDVFSLPTSSVVSTQPPISLPADNGVAKPVKNFIIVESPYYELVYNYGQKAVDRLLEGDNDLAGQIASAVIDLPNDVILAELVTSLSNNFDNAESLTECEMRTLVQQINKMESVITLDNAPRNSEYTWILIDDEILFVESCNGNQLTVKRGCLDTIPEIHNQNSRVYFCGGQLTIKTEDYYEGDKVDCRIITSTSTGSLDPKDATGRVIDINGRAIRPYPPANVTINGCYYPASILDKTIDINWSSRNRLQQTSGVMVGWYEGNVTVEPDVKYRIVLRHFTNTLIDTITEEPSFSFDISHLKKGDLSIELSSIKNDLESSQKFRHSIIVGKDIEFIFNKERQNELEFKFED
ncbi:phage tail protein [Gilliamella sp. ESL0250]|uniref:phage tail protein n=1 Tax=Gilliamella sp. ESL0250 TaxID=2705036 RepID=UPI00157FE322|nr:phage tail protein [Gilliamella sp. ESL0250]NUF48737.1 VWA domain-containing protein [Gilliamella sp. ESL0250]